MRSPRYYINQLYLVVAIKMLERVQFKSQMNRQLLAERIKELKRSRQCL